MFIIKITDGIIQEPKSVKDVQEQAKGILKYEDCFVADNYTNADAFIIRTIDVRKAHIFATETQAKLYASFLRDAGFNQHPMVIQEMTIKLDDKFTIKGDKNGNN